MEQNFSAAACLIGLCPPTEPGTPFGTPLLIATDSIRTVVCLISLLVVWRATTRALDPDEPSRIRIGCIALASYSVAAVGTEISHLGDYPHYRLLLFVIGSLAGLFWFRNPRTVGTDDS